MNWFFALLGAALAAWSAHEYWRGRASLSWPAADGEVMSSTVRERRGRRGPFYESDVEYRYAVGGVEFTGRRPSFGGVRLAERSPAVAYAELGGLEPGARVPVYYDPRDPRRSVLRPGSRREDLGFVAIGLTLAWAAAARG